MESDDDTQVLINDEERLIESGDGGVSRDQYLGLMEGLITTEPELEEVVYGYRSSRWRGLLVQVLSVLCAGVPLLIFHWWPTWRLYSTAVRAPLHQADLVLVVETYQKKCKSYYIHRILVNHVADTRGLSNDGYQPEKDDHKLPIPDDVDVPIHLEDGTQLRVQSYRYFRHKKCVLVWDDWRGRFAALGGLECGQTCVQLHELAKSRSDERHAKMQNIYGPNIISVPVQSIMTLILLEVFNPFYVFQLFTIAVWLAEPYYYYCIAVILMSTFGVATSVIQTKRNQRNLRDTVQRSETLWLEGADEVSLGVGSAAAAPGDVLLLPAGGCRLHCDAVLLHGAALLNESMLTGESVPVSKTPLPQSCQRYDSKAHEAHTLYSGTQLIQTRTHNNQPVRALVIRTGYHTNKGQLVRSILYPIPTDFKFDRDSYKFIFILAVIAMLGLAYTVALKTYRALSVRDIVIKALDILTIVIPPALPAALTVGRLTAAARLRRAKVLCLNTRAVTVAGSIDCMCFDKTGTLTEEGLDMRGVVTCSPAPPPPPPGAPPTHPSVPPTPPDAPPTPPGSPPAPRLRRAMRAAASLNDLEPAKLAMATCHSLTLVDGHLTGDPLDLKMFESTGWTLEEPETPDHGDGGVLAHTLVKPRRQTNIDVDNFHVPLEVLMVHQYQFSSQLQRASVATAVRGEDVLRLYCKGAPETLRHLCRPDTVPDNLDEVLSSYAEEGYRVIALSTRVLELKYSQLKKMTREEMECDLEFLGLVVMENRLKPAAAGVIQELMEANIHVVMVTGDNIHTAVSVAKECGILSSDERVVRVRPGPSGGLYCESTIRGTVVGGPWQVPAGGGDSGLGSWASGGESGGSGGEPGGGGGEPGGGRGEPGGGGVEAPTLSPNYKIVMTGDAWKILRDRYPEMVPRMLSEGAVFARMSPDQKQQLVVEYQALGYYVGMCGDGANDCGALRAAHAGISLSAEGGGGAGAGGGREEEGECEDGGTEGGAAASFCARRLAAAAAVLREGRAALVTCAGLFKFMVAYSLTEFLSVAFLYYFDSNLTDFQFLFIDVALIVNFAFFFGQTEAYTGKLHKVPPLTSLLGLVPLVSLIGHLTLIAVAQYLSYYAVSLFPWYVRHTYVGEEENECWENYAIYAVSMFQYIIMALVFSHGAPYRRSVVTNKQLMISILIMTGVSIYITVSPTEWLARFFQLQMPLDVLMCYIVLAIAATNLLLALFFERVIVQYLMEEKQMIPKFLKERRVRKTPYLMIKRQLTQSDYLNCDDAVAYHKETDCSN